MSRSGYTDDCDDNWDMIRWRGAVTSAIRGKRGQAFLREMAEALDAMPEKRLIIEELVGPEGCCALGSVAMQRGLDVSRLDPENSREVAAAFGIPRALASEVAYLNDEECHYSTDEERWRQMRAWVQEQIR